ncbi:hypothetical protein BC834DRAFT_325607 [Gloeopeniophorella convolvens]|nr:hypothetical protein BC834DRAFT_325607 [Gloeopeniophorella convolvens]
MQAVSVVYFDKQKGEGLIAKAPIAESQVVWKEDPFVFGPEWDIYDLPAQFCNRLSLKRAERTHLRLCAAQNPASAPLLAFARQHAWTALHALTHCAARLLLAAQAGDAALAEDWRVYSALAKLGMEERAQESWLHTWRRARPRNVGGRAHYILRWLRPRTRRAGPFRSRGPNWPRAARGSEKDAGGGGAMPARASGDQGDELERWLGDYAKTSARVRSGRSMSMKRRALWRDAPRAGGGDVAPDCIPLCAVHPRGRTGGAQLLYVSRHLELGAHRGTAAGDCCYQRRPLPLRILVILKARR